MNCKMKNNKRKEVSDMKIFVYSMKDYEAGYFEYFQKKYQVECKTTSQDPSLDNLEWARGFDGVDIITTKTDAVIIEKLHELGVKYIATRTIGYDHVDVKKAHELGMRVTNLSYSPSSVADYTIMLMLMGCRKMDYILSRARLQDFTLNGKMGIELSKCTIGVIGTGRIGRTVIEHLSGFGCKILAYDIYESEEVKKHATYTDLNTLYKESDIVTLHAPATNENYHMLNDEAFARMKDGVMIINCARGSLIDTQALIRGLDSKKIGFAGLDVIENEFDLYYYNRMGEPLANHDLYLLSSYPNVIVSPHTAFFTNEAVSNMVENSIKGLLCFENGEENPFEV
jgi:D-lactate dehydrogenase